MPQFEMEINNTNDDETTPVIPVPALARQANIDEMKSMSQRVSDWHNSLRAVLQESQSRNCFDIHEFGTHIIDLVKSRGSLSTFEDVLVGRHPSSIANYFLSMLQLVSIGIAIRT